MAATNTQIVAQCGVPTIWRGHDLPRPVALNFACRIAGRTRHRIAFVSDVFVAQSNRSGCGMNDAISCRLVAVQNQISFHSVP